MNRFLRIALLALLLAGTTGLLTGCLMDDPDTPYNKPWNTPQSWEGPMPSNMNNGR